jgi:hypothetical protein
MGGWRDGYYFYFLINIIFNHMVQRVTYRRRLSYNTASNKVRKVKTPGTPPPYPRLPRRRPLCRQTRTRTPCSPRQLRLRQAHQRHRSAPSLPLQASRQEGQNRLQGLRRRPLRRLRQVTHHPRLPPRGNQDHQARQAGRQEVIYLNLTRIPGASHQYLIPVAQYAIGAWMVTAQF